MTQSNQMKLKSGCLWVTGLSASGKTSITTLIYEKLNTKYSNVVKLDGDELRKIFQVSASCYTREDRIQLGLTYSRLVSELVSQGIFVIIAVIGLYDEIHLWNRSHISPFYDVFLDVPFIELRSRDPKGLYLRHDNGLVSNVAGLDFSVDPPTNPWVHINWSPGSTAETLASYLITKLFSAHCPEDCND